nr:hypothetical protein [Fontibacillus phaseoli]
MLQFFQLGPAITARAAARALGGTLAGSSKEIGHGLNLAAARATFGARLGIYAAWSALIILVYLHRPVTSIQWSSAFVVDHYVYYTFCLL